MGNYWYIMVYHGISWYINVHYTSLYLEKQIKTVLRTALKMLDPIGISGQDSQRASGCTSHPHLKAIADRISDFTIPGPKSEGGQAFDESG